MFRSFRIAAVAVLAVVSAGVAHAQTLDDIIAKNLRARGGVEKLRGLTTAKITGDVFQQGIKIHITTYAKRPNLMRREIEATIPAGMGGRGGLNGEPQVMKEVVAFDGTTPWAMGPRTNNVAQAMAGPQADTAKEDADFDSVFLDYKAKGHTIDLVSTETIKGKPAYHLKVTKKGGAVQDYYLDAETGLETRTVSTVKQGAANVELTTDLSNYQTVDGLTMPFTMTQSVNGQAVAEITIAKFEVNVPIDDDLFKMPGAAARTERRHARQQVVARERPHEHVDLGHEQHAGAGKIQGLHVRTMPAQPVGERRSRAVGHTHLGE